MTHAESTLAGLDAEIADIDAALERRRSTRGEASHADIDGQHFTDRGTYAAALAHAVLAATRVGRAGHRAELGTLGALTLRSTLQRERSGQVRVEFEFADAPGDPVTVNSSELDRARSGWCPPWSAATPGSRPAAATPRPPREPPGFERDRARAQLGAPFACADELAEKRARAAELHEAMTDLALTAERPPTPAAPEARKTAGRARPPQEQAAA